MRINFSCFIFCTPKVKILFILTTYFLTNFTQHYSSKILPLHLGCPPLRSSDFLLSKQVRLIAFALFESLEWGTLPLWLSFWIPASIESCSLSSLYKTFISTPCTNTVYLREYTSLQRVDRITDMSIHFSSTLLKYKMIFLKGTFYNKGYQWNFNRLYRIKTSQQIHFPQIDLAI